jgi:hypothetical protein
MYWLCISTMRSNYNEFALNHGGNHRPRSAIHTPPAVRQIPLTISMARMRERESQVPALPAINA